ncbi:MAG: cell division protein FtsA [Chloroflexota bacterium]
MSKPTILAAIDVGTTKVCTIIAEVGENGGMRVVGVGITPSNGLHKGLVSNINDAKESIRASIRKAEHVSGYKVESAYVGVTGRHVTSLNNRGVVTIARNDRLVRPEDLKRVLQSAQSTKIPTDRKLLHVIPRGYAVDGQVGVKNPIGMHGLRLDVEAHVITGAIASVQNLTKCIRGVGIDIEDLILEPLASSEAVLTQEERQNGVMLADIGGGTTDIAIFKDGSIWHTAVLPVAGYQLTRDIAIGLGLPFDVAEEMKKQHGSVMPVYEGKRETDSKVGENGHGVSYQALCDILRARTEEMIRLIQLELPRSGESLVPAGLVLTGGSSKLHGMDILGREILKLPVRIGSPAHMPGISDALYDPAYATAVGLLLWGVKNEGTQSRKFRGFNTGLWNLVSRLWSLFH